MDSARTAVRLGRTMFTSFIAARKMNFRRGLRKSTMRKRKESSSIS